MTSNSALELLSSELPGRILLHFQSFEALSTLIHASPRVFQHFRLNKTIILSEVAHRHRAWRNNARLSSLHFRETSAPNLGKITMKHFR